MKYSDEQRIAKISEIANWSIISDIVFDVIPEFQKQLSASCP